jgi:hypothetical protein
VRDKQAQPLQTPRWDKEKFDESSEKDLGERSPAYKFYELLTKQGKNRKHNGAAKD